MVPPRLASLLPTCGARICSHGATFKRWFTPRPQVEHPPARGIPRLHAGANHAGRGRPSGRLTTGSIASHRPTRAATAFRTVRPQQGALVADIRGGTSV